MISWNFFISKQPLEVTKILLKTKGNPLSQPCCGMSLLFPRKDTSHGAFYWEQQCSLFYPIQIIRKKTSSSEVLCFKARILVAIFTQKRALFKVVAKTNKPGLICKESSLLKPGL
jgi:hypothetical protein